MDHQPAPLFQTDEDLASSCKSDLDNQERVCDESGAQLSHRPEQENLHRKTIVNFDTFKRHLWNMMSRGEDQPHH
jgi:predicted amidophosphoribosyltransferase